MLIDTQAPALNSILGVLWATPFKETIVRVAAFVIAAPHQVKPWDRKLGACSPERHGRMDTDMCSWKSKPKTSGSILLSTTWHGDQQPLTGYYQSGLGYMMRGPLEAPEFTKDYSPPQSG